MRGGSFLRITNATLEFVGSSNTVTQRRRLHFTTSGSRGKCTRLPLKCRDGAGPGPALTLTSQIQGGSTLMPLQRFLTLPQAQHTAEGMVEPVLPGVQRPAENWQRVSLPTRGGQARSASLSEEAQHIWRGCGGGSEEMASYFSLRNPFSQGQKDRNPGTPPSLPLKRGFTRQRRDGARQKTRGPCASSATPYAPC